MFLGFFRAHHWAPLKCRPGPCAICTICHIRSICIFRSHPFSCNNVNSTYPLGHRHISTMAVIRGVVSSSAGLCLPLAESQPLAAWLDSVRNQKITWHVILNNSTSTRPSKRGGKLFPSLSSLYVDLQDNDRYNCFLQFPCSFAPDDGFDFQVSGCGGSVDEARNAACLHAFAYLLKQRPEWVIFRSNHWKMSDVQFCEGLQVFFFRGASLNSTSLWLSQGPIRTSSSNFEWTAR